jgi:hypothetical protein
MIASPGFRLWCRHEGIHDRADLMSLQPDIAQFAIAQPPQLAQRADATTQIHQCVTDASAHLQEPAQPLKESTATFQCSALYRRFDVTCPRHCETYLQVHLLLDADHPAIEYAASNETSLDDRQA